MARCPATDTVTVEGEPLELQCVMWGDPTDPQDRHADDHLAHLPPALGGDYRWTNENPLPPKPETDGQ